MRVPRPAHRLFALSLLFAAVATVACRDAAAPRGDQVATFGTGLGDTVPPDTTPPDTTPTDTTYRGIIHGRVIGIDSSATPVFRPLAQARVTLLPATGDSLAGPSRAPLGTAVTDTSGFFRFSGIARGSYRLRIQARGGYGVTTVTGVVPGPNDANTPFTNVYLSRR